MIDYIVAILIGVLSSIVASIIFILFLCRLRPKIIISPEIAKWKTINGERIYQIKVINKTGRSIMNIKAKLSLVTYRERPGGRTPATEKIPLYKSEVMELSKFDLEDTEDNHAFRFGTYIDIEKLWNDEESFFRFKVYGTDSFSGFGEVFVQDYHIKKSPIVEGDFHAGNSLEIKREIKNIPIHHSTEV